MAEPGRGYTRWRLILPVMAVPVLVLGFLTAGFFVWALSEEGDPRAGALSGEGDPRSGALKKVTCAEALAFGGASAPAHAQVGSCTMQQGIDTAYTAVLRMPREDVRGWLRETYPKAPEARSDASCGALCLDVSHEDGLPATAGAHVVQVRVEYVNAETARMRFSAFTM